jgi:hypothetical protein
VAATVAVAVAVLAGVAAAAAVSSPTPSSPFPLQVSSNGRYLETAQGTPWLMVGDSPWTAIGNISTTTAASYFADREAHGFDAALIALLCDDYTGCNSNGQTYDGIPPFTAVLSGPNPPSSPATFNIADPNPTYFSRAHQIVAEAEADNIAVLLDPVETGGCQRWMDMLGNNGNGVAGSSNPDYQYGVFLGNEFKDLPNIIWTSGNDFQCIETATDKNNALAVAEGIQSVDPSALQTLEVDFCGGGGYTCQGSSSLVDANGNSTGWSSVVSLNGSYTYSPTYAEDLAAYGQSSSKPMFLIEANYENEQNPFTDGCAPSGGDPINCRLQAWWTMTSGATGQLYGNHNSWATLSNSTDMSSLDTLGVAQLGYQTSLLSGLAWYNLAPDTGHALIYCGSSGTACGTYSSTGSIDTGPGANYVTDAETSDKTLALAYFPQPSGHTLSSVTVNFGSMLSGGSTTARWYDPTNGTFAPVTGSPFTDSAGAQTINLPGANSEGDHDWVLVLQTTQPPTVSVLPAGPKDFGGQQVGTVSAAQTFTITDTGTGTLDVASVGLGGAAPGQFVESNDQCSGQAIAAGGTCTVEVAFAPTATGTQDATLEIASNDPASPESVALSGTGGESAVSASPASVNFGKYPAGNQSPPQTFTITNTGTATLNITSATLVGAAALQYVLLNDQCSGRSVGPTESCTVDVAFSPVSVGPKQNASLRISSDAPSSPDDLSLTGQAIGPANRLASDFRTMHLRTRVTAWLRSHCPFPARWW